MTGAFHRFLLVLSLACLVVSPIFAQAEPPAGGVGFSMGLGIGVQTFNGTDEPGTYQSLSLTPEITSGKLGVGFDFTVDFKLTGSGNSITGRRADWWPNGSATLQNVAAIYLPKISYITWGRQGDPVFLKIGSFDDVTLGDGFLMGAYNNTLFVPTERHLGLQATVDGTLFDFPYLGLETVVGNLASLDVLGARLSVKPLAKTSNTLLSNFQIGLTAAVDTNPHFETVSATTGSASPLGVFGVDALIPLVSTKDGFSLNALMDGATLQWKTWGSMVGAEGRLVNIFTYGAQLRVMDSGFTAPYFGTDYDVQRDVQYNNLQSMSASGLTFGGLVSGGISLLGDNLVFKITLDAPFVTNETDPTLRDPHLNAILTLAPGALPVLSFDFTYDKKGIGTFGQLVDATNTIVQAGLNLQSGPAAISFVYDFNYDPREMAVTGSPWTVTSGLQASVALF